MHSEQIYLRLRYTCIQFKDTMYVTLELLFLEKLEKFQID